MSHTVVAQRVETIASHNAKQACVTDQHKIVAAIRPSGELAAGRSSHDSKESCDPVRSAIRSDPGGLPLRLLVLRTEHLAKRGRVLDQADHCM